MRWNVSSLTGVHFGANEACVTELFEDLRAEEKNGRPVLTMSCNRVNRVSGPVSVRDTVRTVSISPVRSP